MNVDLGKEIVEPPEPEQQRRKDSGKEDIEQQVVRFKNHDLASELGLVEHAGLEEAHDRDIAECDKDEQTDNVDDDELELAGFLHRGKCCLLPRLGGGFVIGFTHLFY